MSKQHVFSDQMEWFYTHCSSMHSMLKTKKGMIDTAIWVMRHVKKDMLHMRIIPTVKKEFAELLLYNNKFFGGIKHCHVYDDPICE
jgi:hypothetical protein